MQYEKGQIPMYKKVDGTPRMHENEASELYPDSFIIMRMDDMVSQTGSVLYIGDTYKELLSLVMRFENPSHCGVIEGLNHRRSLGGVVVGG